MSDLQERLPHSEAHGAPPAVLRWVDTAGTLDDAWRERLTACWMEVANSGGAVGFPFPPVGWAEVAAATDALVASLSPSGQALLLATRDGELLGWLVLVRNQSALTAHWGRLQRVQTSLAARGRGVGRLLMEEAIRAARDDHGLEQLRIEVRAGLGLEGFYERFGWREIGRFPGALRIGPEDDRDEVYMALDLRAP